MAARQLSGWQIVTLIMGKDAVIAIAVILVLGVAFVSWFLNG